MNPPKTVRILGQFKVFLKKLRNYRGVGWRMRGRLKREGKYVYIKLIHIVVEQKPIQFYKAIILQIKILKMKLHR